MSESSENTKSEWADPDDAPELDDYFFDHADHFRGGVLIKRGRPVGTTKISTTVRFDSDVIDAFRAEGPGWQTRMNRALRDWLDQRTKAA